MKNVYPKKHFRYQGLVLLAVLWIITLLAVIVVVISKTVRLDSRVCLATSEQVRGKWACRAGLEKAIALLNDDPDSTDCLTDLWSNNAADCNDIELKGCIFTIRIIDEEQKLNINTATKNQLMELPDMTAEIADAIIDWRDENDIPEPQGAEAGYYVNLHPGYHIRNGPFQTVRELLLVKDMTAELLYGEDANLNGLLDYNENDREMSPPWDNGDDVLDKGWYAYLTCYSYDDDKDAQGGDRININKADEDRLVDSLQIKRSYAKWIVENRRKGFKSIADLIDKDSPKKQNEQESDKPEKMDLETFSRIADKITVGNKQPIPGRVNINTAPELVLTALFEGDKKLAQAIITHRQTLLGGIQSIAELLKIKSITIETFKKIAHQITTRSNTFNVNCIATGNLTGALHRAEAVVDRNRKPAEIIYWRQGANL